MNLEERQAAMRYRQLSVRAASRYRQSSVRAASRYVKPNPEKVRRLNELRSKVLDASINQDTEKLNEYLKQLKELSCE